MTNRHRWIGRSAVWSACSAAVLAAGCGAPEGNIHSWNPAERVLAIRKAAVARNVHAVPLIVDRLEDEDAAVRMFAILALQEITGERFGYDYSATGSRQAAAVEAWRSYVRRGGHLAGQ